MLNSSELSFVRGVCADAAYPFYLVYQEPQQSGSYYYRNIHIFLSQDPIELAGDVFSCSSNTKHLLLTNDQYFTEVSSGSSSGSIPSDAFCYTSSSDSPLYADLFEPTLEVVNDVPFDHSLLFFLVFGSVLCASAISTVIFGRS